MVIELQDIVITFLATEMKEQISDFACTLTQRGVIGVVHVAKKKIRFHEPPTIEVKVVSKIETIAKEGEDALEVYLGTVTVEDFIKDIDELLTLSQKKIIKDRIIALLKDME
jgi:hypothetical protein